jgi:hypothetical protein
MIPRILLFLACLAAGFLAQELVPAPRPLQSPIATSRKSLYDGYATSAAILRAHARVESDEMDWAVGDDGRSRGRMQICETFHEARAAAYGNYDPHNCFDAIRIADRIWQANAHYFEHVSPRGDPDVWANRRLDLTISSYCSGIRGTKKNGVNWGYVKRVRRWL